MSKEIDDLKAKLKEQKDAVKVSKRREADALVGGAALETAEKKATENEKLREIYLLKPKYVQGFVDDFRKQNLYKKDDNYINQRLKKTG